jgi:predicted transcriptional regulator
MTARDEDEKSSAIIAFRVKPSVKAELERLAKAERRPLSNYLQVVVEDYLEAKRQEAKKKGKA